MLVNTSRIVSILDMDDDNSAWYVPYPCHGIGSSVAKKKNPVLKMCVCIHYNAENWVYGQHRNRKLHFYGHDVSKISEILF